MPSERVDQLNQIIMLDLAHELLSQWEQVGKNRFLFKYIEIQKIHLYYFKSL
jgi:hypothetical protein